LRASTGSQPGPSALLPPKALTQTSPVLRITVVSAQRRALASGVKATNAGARLLAGKPVQLPAARVQQGIERHLSSGRERPALLGGELAKPLCRTLDHGAGASTASSSDGSIRSSLPYADTRLGAPGQGSAIVLSGLGASWGCWTGCLPNARGRIHRSRTEQLATFQGGLRSLRLTHPRCGGLLHPAGADGGQPARPAGGLRGRSLDHVAS
jgi:hypothetical protein